ncbi:hypothetical protein GW17_00035791 [Ensete ventricosum]|nr:hypothetical protein GW17_00035791 [Ensete ventricosum]
MARPLAGVAGHGQAPCTIDHPWLSQLQGSRLRPTSLHRGRQPIGAGAIRGHGRLQRGAHWDDRLQGSTRQGRSPTASPQGAAVCG